MWVLIFHSHKYTIATSAHTHKQTHTFSIHKHACGISTLFFLSKLKLVQISALSGTWVFEITQNWSVGKWWRIKVCLAAIWGRSSDNCLTPFVCSFRMSQPPYMLLLLKPERLSDYLCILPLFCQGERISRFTVVLSQIVSCFYKTFAGP